MTNASNPDVYMPIIGANTEAENAAQRISFVGTMSASGTATEGELQADVAKADIAALFGSDSELYDGFLAAREINKVTPIDIIPFDEPSGGVAAVGTITWAGTATSASSVVVGAGSSRSGAVTVDVPLGTTDAEIAQLVEDAFLALGTGVCTVDVDGTTAEQNNVTYNHKGLQGNKIPLWVKGTIPGLTFAIVATVGGLGSPTLTNAYDAFGNTRYQAVAQVGEWGVTELSAFLEARFNVRNKIVDGTGFVCLTDTAANHITALGSLNYKTIMRKCEDVEDLSWYKGSSMQETTFARACQNAALKALRLTDGANITDYVNTSGGVDDGTGGIELSSLPYANTPLPYPVMPSGFGFTDGEGGEVEAIEAAGGSIDGNNDANAGVVMGKMITTYKTDASGDADPSFKYLNTVDTASSFREYCFNNIKKATRQSRATGGSLKERRNIQNVGSVTNLFIKYYGDCADFLLVESGEESLQFFKKNLSVTLDRQTGYFAVSMKIIPVGQVRGITAPIQLSFTA